MPYHSARIAVIKEYKLNGSQTEPYFDMVECSDRGCVEGRGREGQ